MAWTPWRKIADRLTWYPEHGLHFAVCYELGLASPKDLEDPVPVYVGAAPSEAQEIVALSKEQLALSPRIREALDEDQQLFLRSIGSPTLDGAKQIREERLAEGSYSWNA